jgi:hypothetical protein
MKMKTVNATSQVPLYVQYNDNIAEAKRKRRKAEQIWRKTKSEDGLFSFKRLENHVTHISHKTRGTSMHNL